MTDSEPLGSVHATSSPPSAAERDAAKRAALQEADGAVAAADFRFVTRNVTETERAAVVAVLTAVRREDSGRVKRRERVERQPWRRSQRALRQITEYLDGGSR